jgi:hypothetical protein
MKIKCITKLVTTEPNEKLSRLYDTSVLVFELSEPINQSVFLCIELCEGLVYLYQDEININGKVFTVDLRLNFMDALKDLPDGIDYFKMSFQIEYNDAVNFNVIPNEMLIKNPWL